MHLEQRSHMQSPTRVMRRVERRRMIDLQSYRHPMTTIEMLERLVGFDTTSSRSNLPLLDFVESYLAEHGVPSRRIPNTDGTKANLMATIGPVGEPGVVLSGHTDVVPVEGQDWSSDPFTLVARHGKLFGRGTADMKSFDAAVLAAVPRMVAADLRAPLHIALSYDEEVGGLGARDLVAALAGLPVRPAFCVVGEPTSMRVVTAHKGITTFRVSVAGFERHSSEAPLAVNAVEYAARLIVFIEDLAADIARRGPFEDGYPVPHTTVHVGPVSGGTALNIVPGTAEFVFEIRNLPDQDPRPIAEQIRARAGELTKAMQARRPDTGIDITETAYLPGLATPTDSEIVRWVSELTDQSSFGKVAYGTEAGLFTNAGIPSVVCGPGDIGQAHRPDEFVAVEQLDHVDRFIDRIIDWATRPALVSE